MFHYIAIICVMNINQTVLNTNVIQDVRSCHEIMSYLIYVFTFPPWTRDDHQKVQFIFATRIHITLIICMHITTTICAQLISLSMVVIFVFVYPPNMVFCIFCSIGNHIYHRHSYTNIASDCGNCNCIS